MKETPLGSYEPENFARDLCPFSGRWTEDKLAEARFGDLGLSHNVHTGYFGHIYAGYVKEGVFRSAGSSGGFTKWLLAELLRTKKIDAVVQVYPTGDNQTQYRYEIADSLQRVREGARSAYYPVHLADVLTQMEKAPARRYAVVGVPCFIKAVTELTHQDVRWKERLTFTVGLLCGHMKTKRYAEALAWQMGAAPGIATQVEFRAKYPHVPPLDFRTQATGPQQNEWSANSKSLAAANRWDLGAFKLLACEICDDVAAETADIVIGDAWFGKYVTDPRGNNLILTRNPELASLVETGRRENRLALSEVSLADCLEAQGSNIRHRQLDLKTRLALLPPGPVRRWSLKAGLGRSRSLLQKVRLALSRRSHVWYAKAREKNDLSLFLRKMHFATLAILPVTYPLFGWAAGLTGLIFRGWCRPLERLMPQIFSPYPRLRPKRLFIQPPSFFPGNLGDEAVLCAFFEEAKAAGLQPVLWMAHPAYTPKHFGLELAKFTRWPLFLAWRFDLYTFVATDTFDGAYDQGKRLWLMRDLGRYLPCLVLNASLRSQVSTAVQKHFSVFAKRGVPVYFRDPVSQERAKAVFGAYAKLGADLAFLYPKVTGSLPVSLSSFLDKNRAEGRRVAVFCPSLANYAGFTKESLSKILEVLAEGKTAFVIVQHDKRSREDTEAVALSLSKLGDRALFWNVENAAQVRVLVNKMDFSCTWRMHLGIASLCEERPACVMEYNQKAKALWAEFGLQDLVAANAAEFLQAFHQLEKDPAAYRSQIQNTLPRVRALARQQVLALQDPLI